MSTLSVAATQIACSWDTAAHLEPAERLIHEAARAGTQVILIQELFKASYFCIEQNAKHFAPATAVDENPEIERFQILARELSVVWHCSWYEHAGGAYFNSLAMIGVGGELLGVYRKSHIPIARGYQENHYFNPGDTGFPVWCVWDTRFAKISTGICWDQRFPETARSMVLCGTELSLYPTAIGSEPPPAPDSCDHRQQTMQGHAAAIQLPRVASNRIGTERASDDRSLELTFYRQSFSADDTGDPVAIADDVSALVLVHQFNLAALACISHRSFAADAAKRTVTCCTPDRRLDAVSTAPAPPSGPCSPLQRLCSALATNIGERCRLAEFRAGWRLYRDRRADRYQSLVALDGGVP